MISQAAVFEYLEKSGEKEILICESDAEAQAIADVGKVLGITVCALPDIRVVRGEDLRPYAEEIGELLEALERFYDTKVQGKRAYMAVPLRTLTIPFPKENFFDALRLAFGDEVDTKALQEQLYRWGYTPVDVVTTHGEMSFRGDIVDIFPRGEKRPYRISFFDTEIEQIVTFDPDTQKRDTEEIEEITIKPAFLALDENAYETLAWRCEHSDYDAFVKDIASLGLWHLGEMGYAAPECYGMVHAKNHDEALREIYENDTPLVPRKAFTVPILPDAHRYRDLEVADAAKLIEAHKEKKLLLIARNESVIRASDIPLDSDKEILYSDAIVNLIGDDRLILSLNKPIKRKRVKKPSLVLDELKVGEYVVHENHGVGIFKGIERKTLLGQTEEFVVIEYQGGDILSIPVRNIEVLDRYIADSGTLPVLDKLGKTSFKRLKGKVRDKLFAIASQIINLSAERHLKKGIVLWSNEQGAKSGEERERAATIAAEHRLFMAQAGFVHTEDQEKAIFEVLADMQSGRMMDRLLSADVGFGKTEVAMNAIFVAVRNGYQAMMIAPTTLLSAQHFKSLKARFAQWDIKVAKLDRFSTPKEKKAVAEGFKEGTIDVVVGTHALLKLKPKRLGLVVIDEEHKFGVKQKEALKALSIDVHLLSMSATPIPRSLNMALSHIKSFSEILTPPEARVGIRTFVKNYDPKIVKEAILRERRRGGQIFYVHNRIAGIEEKKSALLELIPDLRITVLHSHIDAKESEAEMLKFEAGEYDLLLSTSIVESGLHLPGANTMIVDGADRFGIADLHQLRGRVGRGGKEGYCYFLVADRDKVTDNAKRRLLALESHSELGSGAVLAFHDLEIRGGGNLIGEAQSGHIKQIGYGLYLRMLEDAIRELSGKEQETTQQTEVTLQIAAYISEETVPQERLRLELYRRLAQCDNAAEVYEIAAEMEDRFGKLDSVTRRFVDVMAIKATAKHKGIKKISSYGERVFVEYRDEDKARTVVQAESKDDDDIVSAALAFVKGSVKA